MSKFNIGDRVVIADPAYLVETIDLQGYVDPEFYGKTGVVNRVEEEDDTLSVIGTAYGVQADGKGYSQTISQRYLSAAPEPEPTPEPVADGVYREKDDEYADTVLVKDGKVVEVLIAGDGCEGPEYIADHLRVFQSASFSFDKVVRLVAPKVEKPVVADGIYVDNSGDIVQIKDGKHRDLQSGVTVFTSAGYEDPAYGPYTPVVTETEAAAK